MDALTFGTPILLRHLQKAESAKLPILEINLQAALVGLDLTYHQFVDLCILLGCDYCDSIKGIGPVNGLKLIKQCGDLEGVIAHCEKKKIALPEPFPYAESRELFLKAEVADATAPECEFKWTDPDEAGLLKYLCEEKQFNEERVKSGIERIKKCKGKNSQVRLESFFGAPVITSHAKKKEPEKGKGKGKGKAGPSGIKKPGGFKR
jgi:flap endonuclease-1